jgi:hypothetical protein
VFIILTRTRVTETRETGLARIEQLQLAVLRQVLEKKEGGERKKGKKEMNSPGPAGIDSTLLSSASTGDKIEKRKKETE